MKKKHWKKIAQNWEMMADIRSQSLQRVWLLAETIEDPVLQHELRSAVIQDFIPVNYTITYAPEEDDEGDDD